MADWANKLAGQLVRIAALFALYTNPHAAEIAKNQMRDAISLAPYFIRHAQVSFELMSGRRSPFGPPAAVLTWIRRKRLTTFTIRQAWRELGGQGWVTKTDDVREAIADLTELGWVRPVKESAERSRGRPSERYDVHPETHKQAAKNADIRQLATPGEGSGIFGSATDASQNANGASRATQREPDTAAAEQTCCKDGDALRLSCQLCAKSPTYWQRDAS